MSPVKSIRIAACLVTLALSCKLLTTAQNPPGNTLQFAPGPPDGLGLAIAAAKKIRNIEPVDTLQLSPPLPLYTLESDALSTGKGLETARACGFQYLLESSDARFMGTAEVHVDSDCASRMRGLGTGAFGLNTREALQALPAGDQVRSGRYEPRMIYANLNYLDVSQSQFVAIWLKSLRKGEDLVYPLGEQLWQNKLYPASEFLKRLRPLLGKVEWSSDYDLHAYFVGRFLASPGNGISRVYQDPMALRDSMRLRITSRDTYKLESLDLIGIGKHSEPVVFLGRWHQTVSLNRQTRPITKFERRAVAELKAGEDVAVDADNKGRVVVGALRAEQDCLKCHGGKTGDVLGALSYRLTSSERVNSGVVLNLDSR